jgi:membrane associated rhomboid family serine protease
VRVRVAVMSAEPNPLQAAQERVNALPLLARTVAYAAPVVAIVLNPIFHFDDFVVFAPIDVLQRAQLHRIFTHIFYIEGLFSCVFVVIAAVRVLGEWETVYGTLRTAHDLLLASAATNACTVAFSILVGGFYPAVFKENFISGTGVLQAMFTFFVRRLMRLPSNIDVQVPVLGIVPPKRLPFAVAFLLVLFGVNVLEVFASLYVGIAWAGSSLDWVTVSDATLADWENGVLLSVSRKPGYVAVNGQMLPVETDRGNASASQAGSVESVESVLRDVQHRFSRLAAAFARRRNRDDASATSRDAPARDDADAGTSSTTDADTRPKPTTREERAAAFAASYERRMAQQRDGQTDETGDPQDASTGRDENV